MRQRLGVGPKLSLREEKTSKRLVEGGADDVGALLAGEVAALGAAWERKGSRLKPEITGGTPSCGRPFESSKDL